MERIYTLHASDLGCDSELKIVVSPSVGDIGSLHFGLIFFTSSLE